MFMMKRCCWVDLSCPSYIRYHDEEWGLPVYDDRLLFEMLILEGFQAGLSWQIILRKRADFKKAFDNFDVHKVSNYNFEKVDELMKNSAIIRHRLKIKSAVLNAKIFIQIQKEWGSFSSYLWHWTNGNVVKGNGTQTKNKLSDDISFDLKKRGMKFVGSTIVYSYLQAVGVIDDHQESCSFRINK
jgi:DNA-3-methyladenine glycosylase I